MSFLNRLFGKSEPPKQRVQVCVECGMPVADHKQWCSILQGKIEMQQKAAEQKNSVKNSKCVQCGTVPRVRNVHYASGARCNYWQAPDAPLAPKHCTHPWNRTHCTHPVFYSERSACITSTREARAAGISDARIAAATRITAAPSSGSAPGIVISVR